MQALKTVLVFGAAGQLGVDCVKVMQSPDRVIVPLDIQDVDLSDPEACRRALDHHQPEIIINCAAWTDVDGAESHPEQARRINVCAPGAMAAWVEAHNAWLIHVSTDFVFDGDRPSDQAYTEEDDPRPLSVYGLTKWQGEAAVRRETRRCSILRTAWLYGATGRNFPSTILRLALAGEPDREIKVVDDQYGTPTWSLRLAKQIERIAPHRVPGVLHASAEGQCTWYGFARAFLSAMNVPARLVPCDTAAFPRPARRPANATLANQRLKAVGHHVMRDWRADLELFVEQHRDALLEKASKL